MNDVNLDDRVLRQIVANLPGELDAWLAEVSGDILGEIVASFGSSPSSPGEPPGVDTGNLRDGMGAERVGPLSYIVYAQAEYAPYLEFGTERMAKRPYFTPVIEAWRRGKLAASAEKAGLFRP